MLVHCRRPAMATWFEVWLCGDDAEHLSAVGEAALDEVARVEQLLSRFDRTSEVSRVNREASQRPVLVDRELFTVLDDCRRQFERTEGYFDVRIMAASPSTRSFAETVLLDEDTRTVRFLDPTITLDFGGYGKGYALDQAARMLEEFGVSSALMHGGTSSVLARGLAEDGKPWRVGLRDPFAGNELVQLALSDCGLSSSALFDLGVADSDILDPKTGRRLWEPAACTVIGPTALEPEVLSTALLVMGKARAADFVRGHLAAGYRVAWIEPMTGGAALRWLGEG
jgi:thiamine biosynthesis lipoprotein